ncbi:MAG: phospholipase D-like domain-containing protein [Bdellovibrionota bacterium]
MLARLLFITLFLSLSAQAYSPKAGWLTQLKSIDDLELVATPEQNHAPLFEAFAKAQKTIRIGIFGISSQEMADQIEKQIKRGINVTIICDKYCTNNEKRKTIFEQLKKAGANIMVATKGFTISHWKMFVIDDSLAFISTMNFISRSHQMRDFGVFTADKSVISEIISVFDQDVKNAANQTNITPELASTNLVWSPNNSEAKLVDLINSADKSIEIWIKNMGHPKIHEALQAAVKRKVNVRVLTSVCGLGMSGPAAYKNLNDLKKRGVSVKGTPYPATAGIPYIHAKTINVDHQAVFLGSENFSNNSITKARELGIVFKDVAVEQQMAALYEKDWAQAVDIPEQAPEKCSPLTSNTEE